MTIERIVPNISSSEFEKSKEFYSDFLGLELVMDMGWILTFCSKSNPKAQITLVKKEGHDAPNDCITITIEVSNIDELYQKAIVRGYEIVYPITNEPWGVRRFFVKDPNGVVINLMCHLEK